MKEGEIWKQIGKTEMIKDNLNPLFETSFFINYFFEKHQYLKFEVLDGDNMSGKSKIIGSA
jgi:Ca2+-dependent lipid-binding protein